MLRLFLFSPQKLRTPFSAKWKDLRTALWKPSADGTERLFHTVENFAAAGTPRPPEHFPQNFLKWAKIVENTFSAAAEARFSGTDNILSKIRVEFVGYLREIL